jgi:hypothetical protein
MLSAPVASPSDPSTRGPRPRRRSPLAIAVLVLTALVATLAVPATAQEAPLTEDPAEAGAGWLARQFVDGNRLQTSFGGSDFDDQGLTIDGIFALAAAGVADDVAADATTWLGRSDVLEGYVGDGTVSSWAGALAKTALVVQVRGLDPTSFGEDDVDLIARLLDREQPNGRFTDLADFGDGPVDFSNAITQSLAILALHRHGSGLSTDAVDLLLESQCADGGFDLRLEVDPSECTSLADATSFAVQALLAVGNPAAQAGLDHLAAVQLDDGGFQGSDEPSANSAGLAAQAFAAGDRVGPLEDAVGFLVGLQQGCDAPEDDRGGIAAGPSGFSDDTAVRATTQAVPGLAGVSLVDLSAAGSTADVPVLDCTPAAPAPTTTTAPPSPGEEPVPEEPATAPRAVAAPVAQAQPTFAG